MKPLSPDGLRALRAARETIASGWSLTQADCDRLDSHWAPLVSPDDHDTAERFGIARPDGSTTGVHGPRWLFHLLGLCHRSAHVGFVTPTGLIVIQRRSPTKADWPDAWDMAVAGHVPLTDADEELGYEEGAWKEIQEELGLCEKDRALTLCEGRLVEVCPPFYTFDMDEARNPPFYNAEVHQVYAASLTPEGLARLKPDPEELAGIYLCPPEEAWDLHTREEIASGLRYSLPRFLDWLIRRQVGAT
jgi:isopentenyldiphosphate isomerase